MIRIARVALAVVTVCAASVVPAPPARAEDDDQENVECTWSADDGQPRGYAWDFEGGHDAARPEVAAAHRRAATDLNEIMGGRVVVRYNPKATWGLYDAAARVRVRIEDYGRTAYAGWWDPWGSCWSFGGGPFHYTYGDIVYNSWYTDRHGGREEGFVVSPGHLPSLTLHETFHSIGGDHLPLETTNPPSTCNQSFESLAPFVSGGDCEALGGFAKPGDVAELQRHYPLPTAGGSCTRSSAAGDLCTLDLPIDS
ncbi:MAG TPA: hypothetical protein VF230_04530 [Acidimicrobiales bacterium]